MTSNREIRSKISSIITSLGYKNAVESTIYNLFIYMIYNQFQGGCHALSSVLYVALCEIGLKPILCIGECEYPNQKPFDHSWIELDGKVIDLAIYLPLDQSVGSFGGPVICDIDILTSQNSPIKYGINTGLPLSEETRFILDCPFSDYMTSFPNEVNGLWTVLRKILPKYYSFNIAKLYEKYLNVERTLIR